MVERDFEGWLESECGAPDGSRDGEGTGVAIRALDALAAREGLNPAYRTGVLRMAFQLAASAAEVEDAWRRYRALAFDPDMGLGELAADVATLGDLAVELSDDAALSRARVELTRLVAAARRRPEAEAAPAVDWAAFADVLSGWNRPDVLRAERAFERQVRDWAAGSPAPDTVVAALTVLADDARRRADGDAAAFLINGRRCYWAATLLLDLAGDLPAAWREYQAACADMDPEDQANVLIALCRHALRPGAPSRLRRPLVLEIRRFLDLWPRSPVGARRVSRETLQPVLEGLLADLERPTE